MEDYHKKKMNLYVGTIGQLTERFDAAYNEPSEKMTSSRAAFLLENLEMYYYQPDDMTKKQRQALLFAIDTLKTTPDREENQ